MFCLDEGPGDERVTPVRCTRTEEGARSRRYYEASASSRALISFGIDVANVRVSIRARWK